MIDSTTPRRVVSCLLVVAVLAAAGLAGVAASEYAVSTGSETDTPERTVDVEGSSYAISSVATAQVDGSLTASIQVPDDTSYVLDIYNDDEQAVVDTRNGHGSQTESIDLSGVDPGTYAITLKNDGNVEDVKPLVVEGVSVSVSVPGEIEAGESLTATVETSSIDGETTPQTVEIAVWNGEETIRVDATETADGTYEATVDGLAAGDYRVYAAAQGSGTVMGEPNAIGVSDGAWVTVAENDGGSDPGGPGDGDDDGDDSDGGDDETNSSIDGETNSSTDDDPTDDETNGTDTDGTDGDDGSDNDSSSGLQTPTEPDDETGDDADAVPFAGPAVLVVSLSLLLGGSLYRRLN